MAEPQENRKIAESYELEDMESSEEPADQDTSSIEVSDCSDSSSDDWQLISSESSGESDAESVSSSSSSSSGSGTSCSFVRVSSPCSSRSSSISEPVTPVVQVCDMSEAVTALTTPQVKTESPVDIPHLPTPLKPSLIEADLTPELHVIDDVIDVAETSLSSSTLTSSSSGRDTELDTSCTEQIECIQAPKEEASLQPSQTVLIRHRSQATSEESSLPTAAKALFDRLQKRTVIWNSRPWSLVSLATLLFFVFTAGLLAGILLVRNTNSAKEPTVVKNTGHIDEYIGDSIDEEPEGWDGTAKERELKSPDVDASGSMARTEEDFDTLECGWRRKDYEVIEDDTKDIGAEEELLLNERATSSDDIAIAMDDKEDRIYAEVNDDITIETEEVKKSDGNEQKPDDDICAIHGDDEEDEICAEVNDDITIATEVERSDGNEQKLDVSQAMYNNVEIDEQQRQDEEPHDYTLRQLHRLIQVMISKGLISEKEAAQLYYLPTLIRQKMQRASENIPWLQTSLRRLTSQLGEQLQTLVSDLQCQRTVSSATDSIKSMFEDFLEEAMKHQPTIYSTLFTWQEKMKQVSDSVIKQFYSSDDGTERRSKERSFSKQEEQTEHSRDRNEHIQGLHEGPEVDDQTARYEEDFEHESTIKNGGFEDLGHKLKNKYEKLFKNSKRLLNSVKEIVSNNLRKIPGEVNNIALAIKHNGIFEKFGRKLKEKAADLNEELMKRFSKLSKYVTKQKSKLAKGYDEEKQWKKKFFKKQSKLQMRVRSAHSLPLHDDDWGELYTDLYDFALTYSARAIEIKQDKWIMCQMQWWNRAAYIHSQCYDVLEPWQLKWKESGDSEPEEADGARYWGRASHREASDVSDDWYLHPRPVVVDNDIGDRSGHWWLRRHQHYHKSDDCIE